MSVPSAWTSMRTGTSCGSSLVLMVRSSLPVPSVPSPTTGTKSFTSFLCSLPQPLCGPLAHADQEDLPHLQAACPPGPWGRGGRGDTGARGRCGRGAQGPAGLRADPAPGLQPHPPHLLWLLSPSPPDFSWALHRPPTFSFLLFLHTSHPGLRLPLSPVGNLLTQAFLPQVL